MLGNNDLSNLNVYYGWSVMNKIRHDIAISVIFENEVGFSDRRQSQIKRLQNTCYVRKQTIAEAEDGKACNRTLTEYSMFLHSKQVKGNLEMLLEANYQADINNVSEPILMSIRDALRSKFKSSYPDNSFRHETKN